MTHEAEFLYKTVNIHDSEYVMHGHENKMPKYLSKYDLLDYSHKCVLLKTLH